MIDNKQLNITFNKFNDMLKKVNARTKTINQFVHVMNNPVYD